MSPIGHARAGDATAHDAPADESLVEHALVEEALVEEALVEEVCRVVAAASGDADELVADAVRRLAPLSTDVHRRAVAARAIAHLSGLGELDALVHDTAVDEVLVNGDGSVWVDRGGALEALGSLRRPRVELLIERVLAPLGRRVDRTSPIVDARLDDGSRVCVVLPPVAVDGPTLSIRRFASGYLGVDAFTGPVGVGLVDELLHRRCNIVVSGATSSGKTSLVAALVARCSPAERLVVIEDTSELPVRDRHVVRLESRPPAADGPPPIELAQLVRTALRLRPDRLVVGEIRGDEVLALVQAMNTGHDGSLATCHANGSLDALLRLESLTLAAAPSWPLAAIREQLDRSIDIVIHLQRLPGSTRRRIVAVDEVQPDAHRRLRPLARSSGDDLAVVASPARTRR